VRRSFPRLEVARCTIVRLVSYTRCRGAQQRCDTGGLLLPPALPPSISAAPAAAASHSPHPQSSSSSPAPQLPGRMGRFELALDVLLSPLQVGRLPEERPFTQAASQLRELSELATGMRAAAGRSGHLPPPPSLHRQAIPCLQ